jgi:formamidopyrimidine-DNA glycosylase
MESTMPEGPEVYWLVNNLDKEVKGARIQGVEVNHLSVMGLMELPTAPNGDVLGEARPKIRPKIISPPRTQLESLSDSLESVLVGNMFHLIYRKAKYIIFEMGQDALLSHLGFTGWWIPEWAQDKVPRRFIHALNETTHVRAVINTNRGRLLMADPRTLSKTLYYPDKRWITETTKNIGPDAHFPDGQEALRRVLTSGTRRKIRDILLDQNVACGIGNYLCCEILYDVGLHGAVKAKDLTEIQVIAILHSVVKIMRMALSIDSHHWWRVFRRKETPEGQPVTREVWGRRGFYVCYDKQPIPNGYIPVRSPVRGSKPKGPTHDHPESGQGETKA